MTSNSNKNYTDVYLQKKTVESILVQDDFLTVSPLLSYIDDRKR